MDNFNYKEGCLGPGDILDHTPRIIYSPHIPGFVLDKRFLRYGKHHFCPIDLRQVLNDRYRVMSFLGWGGYGTVWLAVDECPSQHPSPSPKYVALKIFRGTDTPTDDPAGEELFLRKLMQGSCRDHVGRHIIEIFDAFNHASPNGVHQCLVLEVAGPTLSEIAEHEELSMSEIVCLFRQLVKTIKYIHSQGISHGDLDMDNWVLALPNFSDLTEEEMISKLDFQPDSLAHLVRRMDRSLIPPGVPTTVYSENRVRVYSVNQGSPEDTRGILYELQFKLLDFGEAFIGTKAGVRTHSRNTPPELIDQGIASTASDIWALGCIFWQLLAGKPLLSRFDGDSHLERFQGHKKFISFTREERRRKLRRMLPGLWEWPSVADAMLEMILDTLEPRASDRPTAAELLSYPIFSMDLDLGYSPNPGDLIEATTPDGAEGLPPSMTESPGPQVQDASTPTSHSVPSNKVTSALAADATQAVSPTAPPSPVSQEAASDPEEVSPEIRQISQSEHAGSSLQPPSPGPQSSPTSPASVRPIPLVSGEPHSPSPEAPSTISESRSEPEAVRSALQCSDLCRDQAEETDSTGPSSAAHETAPTDLFSSPSGKRKTPPEEWEETGPKRVHRGEILLGS